MKTNPQHSRRHFLKTGLAAGALLPAIRPIRLFAAESSPNNRIRMGFIGVGKQATGGPNGFGGLMRGFISDPSVHVVAVCDPDTTRMQSAKERAEVQHQRTHRQKHEGIAMMQDFREMLERSDIDAVCIATPDHWHAPIAIRATQAGMDIYCEKPLCQSIEEARAMVRATRRNNRVFQVGSMQRSSSEFRVACELVRNGILGDIRRVDVAVGGPAVWCDLPEKTPTRGLDWNLWLGPAPERGWHEALSPVGVHDNYPAWRRYREYGGGGVTDWGAHHFDIAQWGLGMDDSGPVQTFRADSPNAQHGVRHLYANGTEVVHISGNGVTFYGTKGRIYVNRGKFEMELNGQKVADSRDQIPQVESRFLNGAKVRLYRSDNHLADFLHCVRTRNKPICDVEVGARTVTVCHLTNLSYYHHAGFKWDPQREEFVDGTGNPEWLDVPRREPWSALS